MNHLKAQAIRLKAFVRSGERFGVIYLDKEPLVIKRLVPGIDTGAAAHGPETFNVTLKGEPYATEVNASLLNELVLTLVQQERRALS